MSQGNMVYLGLCVRYNPPIIGVHYKNKQTDEKKKVYTIVLQRLVLNPNPMEAAEQLYLEHPHILKQNKIPKEKIAALIEKIQKELKLCDEQDQEEEHQDQDYEQDYEQQQQDQEYQHQEQAPPRVQQKPVEVVAPAKKRPKFDFDKDFGRDDGPLNRSM